MHNHEDLSTPGHPEDVKRNRSARSNTRETDGFLLPSGQSQPVRRLLIFTIVALALLMMSIDTTIVATALDALQRGLHTSINWAGWTITAYSLGYVLMLPISGRLSQQYGRRRVFLGSVAAFTAASLLCGVAGNIYVLIALRAVQAAGGAGITPAATGIVVDHFGDTRDRAVSLFGSVFPIGAMIGPIFGGLFVSYWTWRGVFFVNVPIGVAVVALALRYVPHDHLGAESMRRPDIAGMALLGIGLFAGMFAAAYLGERNAHAWSPVFLVPSAVAIVALWIFVRHINRSAQPFIAPRFIHGPGFGPVNLITGLYGGATLGAIALIPLYATNRYGMNALDSGTLLVAQGGASIALSIIAALSLRRTGYRPPIYIGSIIIAIGMLLLAAGPVAGIPPYLWLACSAFVVGVGYGTSNPASRNAGLQLAPEHSPTIAALRSMFLQVGSIAAVSIATAVLAGSKDPGAIQGWAYAAAAVLLVAALPLIALVPEHHGAW